LRTDDNHHLCTGYQSWSTLTAIFKSLPLSSLRISTSDPFTNRAVFDSARDLVCTQRRPLKFVWIVSANVDDAGRCFVPISRVTFTSSSNSTVDFVKRYLTALDHQHQQNGQLPNSQDSYQLVEGQQWVLVEISTLSDLLNRDINLNAILSSEPKVQVQIVPQ